MAKKVLKVEDAARMLLDYDLGVSGEELAKQYGVTPTAVSWWAKRYTGLSAEWIRHVKDLEHTLTIIANRAQVRSRDIEIGARVISRLLPNFRRRASLGIAVRAEFGISQVRANRIVGLSRTAGTARGLPKIDAEIIGDMRAYIDQNPGHGFDKIYDALLKGRAETRWQCKQMYRNASLHIRSRPTNLEVPGRVSKKMTAQSSLNAVWSMDFVTHSTSAGKRFFVLTVIDDFNREALLAEVTSKRSTKFVVECLRRLTAGGRFPKHLRTDNGGEFKGLEYLDWTSKTQIKRLYTRPHTPTDNIFVERFNLTLRQEVLDRYKLRSLLEASRMLEDWRVRYNLSRPHKSLGGLSPMQFAQLV